MIDFQGSKSSTDPGFILLGEIDERFSIIDPKRDFLEDLRSPAHTKQALVQMVRQRVYQIAAYRSDERGWYALIVTGVEPEPGSAGVGINH